MNLNIPKIKQKCSQLSAYWKVNNDEIGLIVIEFYDYRGRLVDVVDAYVYSNDFLPDKAIALGVSMLGPIRAWRHPDAPDNVVSCGCCECDEIRRNQRGSD